jgi:release factor glutamine methyltransferase
MVRTIRELASEVDLPIHEVERLLVLVTGRSRLELIADLRLKDEERRRFGELAARRRAGEPLQYLEGKAPFGPIEVVVDGRVLVPRPETERLWELAVKAVENPGVIVDLCTGSGNLALALKHEFPTARVVATDLSAEALEVARANAERLGLEVQFLKGDLFEPLPEGLRGAVDLVVANPPYVAETEFWDLPVEVREYEPRVALVAGPRGDEALVRIAGEVGGWLARGGWVFCEIGENQAGRAAELFGQALEVTIERDLADRPRYVVARKVE